MSFRLPEAFLAPRQSLLPGRIEEWHLDLVGPFGFGACMEEWFEARAFLLGSLHPTP